MTTRRRDFLGIAGASVAVTLTGSLAQGARPGSGAEDFAVDDQVDPWIELDTDALASNVREIRRRVGSRPIMAVVKCNAYGHGGVEIATALQRNSGVRHFMIVKVREAVDLRLAGVGGMILNVGPFSTRQIPDLLNHDISQAVYTSAVEVLSDLAGKAGKTAKVQVYVDTGMGRVGVPYGSAPAFIEKVAALPNVKIEGIFTDMTEDDDFNPVQIERFKKVCDIAKDRGIDTGIQHAASSAEVDRYPYAWLDMVRPGSCVVGLEPERQHNMEILPVMSFKTRVAFVKTLQAGDALSYHRVFKIEKEMRIATLPCGYSDGYPPVVTNKADVLISGRRQRVIAPITANHMMVDVTGSPEVAIGDEVVLWGRQGDERVTILELEQHAPQATNTYRIATRTRTYLPRVTSGLP